MHKKQDNKKTKTMRNITRFAACLLMLAATATVNAQENNAADAVEKKYDLRPEFTLRGSLGFFNSDHRVSGGVCINGKRTAGLMIGHHNSYIDHAPADIDAIVTTLFYRRYFHLGKRKICAFYLDAYAGAAWVYKVTGTRYEIINEEGDIRPIIDEEPGYAVPVFGLQPGFRVRFYRNIHLFLGPSIATDCIGVHIGIGF